MEDDLMAGVLTRGGCPELSEEETHQEGAEEDEGHKVNIGQVRATALVLVLAGRGRRVRLTAFALQAGQHDLLPRLSCGTPVPNTALSAPRGGTGCPKENPHHPLPRLNTIKHIFRGCSPEEQHEGAQEAAEVVVPVYVAFLVQFDIAKNLQKGEKGLSSPGKSSPAREGAARSCSHP